MEESSGDIENQGPPTTSQAAAKKNPHNNTSSNDHNKKLKLALLSIFLLVVIVLSIVLGVTFQGNTNTDAVSGPTSTVEDEPTDTSDPTLTVVQDETTDTPSDPTPTVDEATYLVSPGPIQARIRMASPTIANGYSSCADLKDDIRNALKHLANTIIVEQSRNGWWYETNCGRDEPVYILEDTLATPEMATPFEGESAMDGESTASKFQEDLAKEDSYETNNQVQGVDEADFVKSDGKHVFTAYGDVIFAWDALDAKKGLSITRMPYNDTADQDCPYFNPMPVDAITIEEDTLPTKEPLVTTTEEVTSAAASSTSTSGQPGRNRKVKMMADFMPMPCYKPKPQIQSLLLRGSRLTAIVSEQSSRYSPYYGAETSTLSDYQDLTIKIFDTENVPLDGSPLTLLGEKKVKGTYHDARSIDNYGIVITTSHVNTYSFTNELYRYRKQYCGMNSTEYEALAKEIALNETESFMEKMVKDLELELDGNCDGIFQVASIQAGGSKEVYDSNLLGEYRRRDQSHRCFSRANFFLLSPTSARSFCPRDEL